MCDPFARRSPRPLMPAPDIDNHQVIALEPFAAPLVLDAGMFGVFAPGDGAGIVGPIADRDLAPSALPTQSTPRKPGCSATRIAIASAAAA
ncbi:hypothetical protein LRS12_06785 [Sphingomonas sp. J344]|uniref:hypothetical protein n=1 Tax=Sphingomonas sp. J344 TaxID=2898434 RepID=UPI002151B52C|nr:hypothetical protein [Sphingomonas sp. J344]MCR5870442.1 hypothetical protein [Sphingomonas sp. J344]